MSEEKSIYRFTPEQLGLKRVTYNGVRYIDVTPFWIDSKESIALQERIAFLKEQEERERRK